VDGWTARGPDEWKIPDPDLKLRRMTLKVTTWNINSVRLRIDLVARFLKSVQPDVLCLQEIK